jgi:hypothetical protein
MGDPINTEDDVGREAAADDQIQVRGVITVNVWDDQRRRSDQILLK